VHVIKRKTLVEFFQRPRFCDAPGPLEAWHYEAKHAQWASPADVKAQYRSASILKDNRVVFNIAGNKLSIGSQNQLSFENRVCAVYWNAPRV